ncbi:hypothetical protein DFH07DRAFT_765322 [Mycena maculata]|uniref:Uncharacterized protein n=1 Tax=Mycena maculata TaxID=230809 RepID=A0AAD7KAW3_9AGAR|nr:hypothetical protein DFH07DRAFT_765322 [Mycena maculata]
MAAMPQQQRGLVPSVMAQQRQGSSGGRTSGVRVRRREVPQNISVGVTKQQQCGGGEHDGVVLQQPVQPQNILSDVSRRQWRRIGCRELASSIGPLSISAATEVTSVKMEVAALIFESQKQSLMDSERAEDSQKYRCRVLTAKTGRGERRHGRNEVWRVAVIGGDRDGGGGGNI